MNPKELVAQFVEEKLEGDINHLATFPLGNLRNDKVYGCPGRNFDSDDTELMRAIYCLVFGEVWENLSMDNLGEGKLRGDTLNTYNTLFSQPWNEKFTAIWNPDDGLKAKMKEFQTTCYTIGNMAVLPDRRIGEWSINKHRGCHNEWHDYEDRFVDALYKVLTGDPDRDLDLEELVELNKEDFKPFYGKDGWIRFVEGNILKDYVDTNFVPIIRSKGYTYWRGGYTNHDRFIAECHRYIDESIRIISNRAMIIIERIRHHLNKASINI